MAMQLSFSLFVFGSRPPFDPGLVGENFPAKDDENKQEEGTVPILYLFPAGASFGPIFSIQPFRSTSCGPTRNQPASYNTITVKVKHRSSFFFICCAHPDKIPVEKVLRVDAMKRSSDLFSRQTRRTKVIKSIEKVFLL